VPDLNVCLDGALWLVVRPCWFVVQVLLGSSNIADVLPYLPAASRNCLWICLSGALRAYHSGGVSLSRCVRQAAGRCSSAAADAQWTFFRSFLRFSGFFDSTGFPPRRRSRLLALRWPCSRLNLAPVTRCSRHLGSWLRFTRVSRAVLYRSSVHVRRLNTGIPAKVRPCR